MASYKIYFLDFCYKNQPSRNENRLLILQNASANACFIEKVGNGASGGVSASRSCRGTIQKIAGVDHALRKVA